MEPAQPDGAGLPMDPGTLACHWAGSSYLHAVLCWSEPCSQEPHAAKLGWADLILCTVVPVMEPGPMCCQIQPSPTWQCTVPG